MSKKSKKRPEDTQKGKQKLQLATEIATREAATFVSGEDYLPNPDKILRAQGGNIKVYREFVDGHLDSVKGKRFAAITSRPWTIDGSKGDAKKAKMLEEYIWNLEQLRDIMSQMLEALGFGYTVHEIVWDAVETEMGTLILPTALKDRPQEWFKFDDKGQLLFQDKNNTRTLVPDKKFIVTRNRPTASNPYGEPVYSRCFWPLAFKKGGLKFWMIFVEKYGIPKAIGKCPPTATTEEQQKFLKMLSNLVRDGVAVITNTGSVELLETKLSGTNPHSEIVKWADSEMSKAWLGETLTTEQTSSGGTQAMATVHNDVRMDLTKDDAAMIESSFNQLIRWIYEINWPNEKVVPWMNIILPEDMQQARLERDSKLTQLGVKFNAKYITDVYGINEDYFEMAEVQPQGGLFAEGPEKKGKVRNTSHELRNQVNAFTEHLEEQCEKIDILAPIRELVENAKSLEEVRDKLGGCYGEMPMDKIAEEMEQAFIASDLAGRFSILKKAGIVDG